MASFGSIDAPDHLRKLNLGCGFDHRDGYLNVDLQSFHKPDLVADCCELALPDGHYEEVVARDLLEHLPRSHTAKALAEWNRVLAADGVLLIRTTRLEGILELLNLPQFKGIEKQRELIQCLFGTQAYDGDFHHTAFTEPLLHDYLENAGFLVEKISVRDHWLFDATARKMTSELRSRGLLERSHHESRPRSEFSTAHDAKRPGPHPSTASEAADTAACEESALQVVDEERAHVLQEGFLTKLYQELLGRAPDPQGSAHYESALASGSLNHFEILGTILNSDEYRHRPRDAQTVPQTSSTCPPDNATYDEQTLAVMRRCLRSSSNCVDVGCHEGSILREMLALAGDGRHFAFEPLPGFYKRLVERFGHLARVEIFDVALSNEAGSSSFQHVVTNPGYSGLRRRRYDRSYERVEAIQVKTDLMDALVPADVRVDFIKIDVEGAELQVLEGAMETIRRSRPVIIFEHGLGGADHYGTAPEEVYDLLSECGLLVSVLDSFLRNGQPLDRAAFVERFRKALDYYFIAHT